MLGRSPEKVSAPNGVGKRAVTNRLPTNTKHVVVEAHGETPDHDYSEDASGAKPCQGEFEHKGEDVERVEKASKATAGRHITSGKDGLAVAKERSAHVRSKRVESEQAFKSTRRSVNH
jgi:hypothetical protein